MATPIDKSYLPVAAGEPLAAGRVSRRKLLLGAAAAGAAATGVLAGGEQNLAGMAVAAASASGVLVGDLTTIGPATPEQISVFLPVDDAMPYTATATCRYKRTADAAWTTGHQLYRIRHDLTQDPAPTLHGFAWPIIDLLDGTSYDVEVTLTNGASVTVHALTHTTRALPAAAGPANKTANSTAAILSALDGLVAGDVLEIANGTYDFSGQTLGITGRGTVGGATIYVRGQSRSGTVLRFMDNRGVLGISACKNLVVENLTLQADGLNNGGYPTGDVPGYPDGTAWPRTVGVSVGGAKNSSANITLRNCVVNGVDRGVFVLHEQNGVLVYNNTFVGNNPWTPSEGPGTSATWGDDGIHIPGAGNCAWQNTLTGFGDSFALCSSNNQTGGVGPALANAVHIYRNDIRNSCDDTIEVDEAEACCTFYDNRLTNGVNCDSLDPLTGGPFLSARNVFLNLYRSRPHKWNSPNRGHFIYNNTVYGPQSRRSAGYDDQGHWYQPNNGSQVSYGYRNNVHVIADTSQPHLLRFSGYGINHSIADWTHNSWYPDASVSIDGKINAASLTAAVAATVPVAPVFSGQTEMLHQDTVTTAAPWVTAITLPSTAATELIGDHRPVPSHASLKNTGVAIPGITDNYTGAAPDRGAIIEGRALVAYGDQTETLPTWVPSTLNQWVDIPGSTFSDYSAGWPNQSGEPPSGGTGGYMATWDFGGPAYSQAHHEVWLFGGGHAGTTTNALMRLVLATNSPYWEVINPGTDPATRASDWEQPTATYNAEPYHSPSAWTGQTAPKSPHAYTANVYLSGIDAFAHVGLGAVNERVNDITAYDAMCVYPRSGSEWQSPALWPAATSPGTYGHTGKVVWTNSSAVFWAGKNSPIYKIVIATKTASTLPNSLDLHASRAVAKDDTTALLFRAGDVASVTQWQLLYLDMQTGTQTPITVSGDPFPGPCFPFGLAYVPQQDVYYIALTSGATNLAFYRLTPTGAATMTAEAMSATGTAPVRSANAVVVGFFYDPTYKTLIVSANNAAPAKAIRISS